ncbi:MAG: glycosyl transferase [Clostridia bacterium]|jgi:membrane peptidoglycan carboxypeptidase|nr:glycosyl transferase [Clostridia bacterium]
MKKWIIRIILLLLLVGIIAGSYIIYQGHAMYQEALSTISLSDKVEKVRQDSSYVKLDTLPLDYKNAVVSVEDRRFYEHGPIDLIAIGRAMITNIRYGKFLEGGSTISQQVAKNLYFISNDTNSMYRKIAEVFMAYDLEKNYKKDEILELYMNTIYFGDGYYGIEEACLGYLKKNAKDMNLYEATQMAGIPNAPSVYAPTVNLKLTLSRQRKVVSTMVENGYLSQEQADEVIAKQPKLTQ